MESKNVTPTHMNYVRLLDFLLMNMKNAILQLCFLGVYGLQLALKIVALQLTVHDAMIDNSIDALRVTQ